MNHIIPIRILVIGLFLQLLPGCAALFDPGPPMANVILPVQLPRASGEARMPLQLLVARPAADESTRTDRIMALMNGFEIRALDAAKWVNPVPQMVQTRLVDSLESTRRFAAVGWEESNLDAKYRLGTDIRRFYLRYEDNGQPPAVDIVMVFTLVNPETGKILARKLTQVEERCSGNSLKEFVDAFSAGMTKALAEVSGWVVERLEAEQATIPVQKK